MKFLLLLTLTASLAQAQSQTLEEIMADILKDQDQVEKTGVITDDCAPEPTGTPFKRDVPRDYSLGDGFSQQPGGWENMIYVSNTNAQRESGFLIRNTGTNNIVSNPKAERIWRFVTRDNSRRESYLWITDSPGLKNSDLMDTMMILLPRKMEPSVKAVGDKIIVTLTTGEKVVYDKNSKVIKEGVFRETRVDLNANAAQRKFAGITYSGTGVMIKINQRGKDPRLNAPTATITQSGKSCTVPTSDLWNQSPDMISFKYADDQKLLSFLNTKCTTAKFKL